MNKIKQSILATIIGLALAGGVSYAQQSWSGASANPPGNNVPAPINVGSSAQAKIGFLSLGTNTSPIVPLNVNGASNFTGLAQFNNSFRIPVNAGSGKVLTSDASGVASWQNASGSSNNFQVYDSGWTPISIGEEKLLTHMLGSDGTIVYFEGKDASGQTHQVNLGTDDGTGFSWRNKNSNSITVKRGQNDDNCNTRYCWTQFRLIMLKVK